MIEDCVVSRGIYHTFQDAFLSSFSPFSLFSSFFIFSPKPPVFIFSSPNSYFPYPAWCLPPVRVVISTALPSGKIPAPPSQGKRSPSGQARAPPCQGKRAQRAPRHAACATQHQKRRACTTPQPGFSAPEMIAACWTLAVVQLVERTAKIQWFKCDILTNTFRDFLR